MTATFATQIEIDPQGVAWIAGTRVKVIEVVLDKLAQGWSPEEIPVLTAQQDGSATLDDRNLLLHSTVLGRVMVSQDTDMLREGARFLREGIEFAGIVPLL